MSNVMINSLATQDLFQRFNVPQAKLIRRMSETLWSWAVIWNEIKQSPPCHTDHKFG